MTAATQTIKMTQTMWTAVIESQATAISIETRTNQTMQTQQLMGVSIACSVEPWLFQMWMHCNTACTVASMKMRASFGVRHP